MAVIHKSRILKHSVPILSGGVSPMQDEILRSTSLINIVYAPTGAGKSYAFRKAMMNGERILFIVPTKQLGKNQHESIIAELTSEEVARTEGRNPWSQSLASTKVQNWNSESRDAIMARGHKSVLSYYHQKLNSLDFRDGGEIIFCTPETLSNIFMTCTPSGARADSGVVSAVNWFDRIVYDEFHTIQERGFGLITTIASCAKAWSQEDKVERKASVFLLSATPVNISKTLSDMGFDTNNEAEVRYIKESLTDGDGRVLHGNVDFEIQDNTTPSSFINTEPLEKFDHNNKLVVIYDSIKRLKQEKNDIQNCLNINEDAVGNINGLDSQIESESSGKSLSLGDKSLIIGTSSIEMGVTIKNAVYLVSEPGFNPLSLLQRIGRVARGDIEGKVVITCRDISSRPWISQLVKCLNELGPEIHINQFSNAFSKVANVDAKMNAQAEDAAHETFGNLGNRASFCCALYHYILVKKLYNVGSARYAKRVASGYDNNKYFSLISGKVSALEKSHAGKKWLSHFLSSAEALREFAPVVKIVSGQKSWSYSEYWLRKNTDILDRNFVQFDDNGTPFVEVSEESFAPAVLEEGNNVQDIRALIMPDGSRRHFIAKTALSDFCYACDGLGVNRMQKAVFKAAKSLVSLTGILPFGDSENESLAQAMYTVI